MVSTGGGTITRDLDSIVNGSILVITAAPLLDLPKQGGWDGCSVRTLCHNLSDVEKGSQSNT